MIAAIIPAVLFYFALFMQVDLESAKLGILGAPRASLPTVCAGAARGLVLSDPVRRADLRPASSGNMEAAIRRAVGDAVLIVLAMVVPHKGKRLTPAEALSRRRGGRRRGDRYHRHHRHRRYPDRRHEHHRRRVFAHPAASRDQRRQPGLLLVITAFAAFLLGLPLPTVGVYIILATLAAPALVQGGIPPMQAHCSCCSTASSAW